MTKVDRILAGFGYLSPRDQKTLARAASILNGKIEQITKYLHLSDNPAEARSRRGEYVTKERRIIQALLGRGNRTQ